MRKTHILWATALLTWGCENDLGEVRGPVGDNPPLADWSDAAPPHEAPADEAAPNVAITSAEEGDDGQVILTGTASDDRAVTAIRIAVGASGPYDVRPTGRGFNAWQTVVPAPAAGPVLIEATAFDGAGNTGTAEAVVDRPMPADDSPPTLVVLQPAHRSQTNSARLFVTGTAADDSAVAEVTVAMRVDGEEMPAVPALTADFFAHWSVAMPLTPARVVTYVVRATDIAGNVTTVEAEVTSRAAPPHDPPTLVSSTPVAGAIVDDLRQTFTLEVDSPVEVDFVGIGPEDPVTGPGPLFPAAAAGDGRFQADLLLQPGLNRLRVVMRDVDGLMARAPFTVIVRDGWGEVTPVVLRAPAEPGGEVRLELDKPGAAELFSLEIQRDFTLMLLDPAPLVSNALTAIREACQVDWSEPHFVDGVFQPNCPPEWGPAERNLWGLLTMTSENVNATGTSLEGAALRAEDLVRTPFGSILAQALQIEEGQVMLGHDPRFQAPIPPAEDPLVAAVIDELIATHPEAENGRLPVTLEAGLADMVPLGTTFGPIPGGHPGFIDDENGGVFAEVLTEDFVMGLKMVSNLRMYDGLDLMARQKSYFADRDPGLDPVELAFLELVDFTLEGIAARPAVDMAFKMVESDRAAIPGRNLEPIGEGDSDVWDFDPWLLERVVARASRNAFADLRTGCNLCAGPAEGALLFQNPTDLAEIAIGTNGYDCVAADHPECGVGVAPNPVGTAEHIAVIDHLFCINDADCDPDMECHAEQNRCVPADQYECTRDRDCEQGERCLLRLCEPADEVDCVSTPECAADELCYEGSCMPVPAGWFRLWMPAGALPLPDPAYMWDIVLEVAQARLRNSGVPIDPDAEPQDLDLDEFIDFVPEGEGDVVFRLQGIDVGLTDVQIEAEVRQSLHADRERLADALLGAYTNLERPIDAFIDRVDGQLWLMLSPCRVGRAWIPDPREDLVEGEEACVPTDGFGAFDSANGGARIDIERAPGDLRGVPLGQPGNPTHDKIYVRLANGETARVEVIELRADDVELWLRDPNPPVEEAQ